MFNIQYGMLIVDCWLIKTSLITASNIAAVEPGVPTPGTFLIGAFLIRTFFVKSVETTYCVSKANLVTTHSPHFSCHTSYLSWHIRTDFNPIGSPNLLRSYWTLVRTAYNAWHITSHLVLSLMMCLGSIWIAYQYPSLLGPVHHSLEPGENIKVWTNNLYLGEEITYYLDKLSAMLQLIFFLLKLSLAAPKIATYHKK